MDFELSEEQAAVAELAGRILADRCTPEALRAHEASGEPMLADEWARLAEAGLLGVALPEPVGGGGCGLVEAALVAEQVGRHVAPVPYAATQAAALLLASLGGHDDLLRGVVEGSVVLAGAHAPASVAAGADGTLTGGVAAVPWAGQAARLVVVATDPDGSPSVHLADPAAGGVSLTDERAMGGLPHATVELAGAPATRLGGAEAAARAEQLAVVLSCATVAGVCEGALRITAGYVSQREQFGVRIGTFQAVAHRMADAYIDTQGVRLTMLQAAWRLAEGVPAAEEVHIAKYWAAEGSHRVVHAAQHLHGGIGMDTSYPIHRYYRWAKVHEQQLGGATDHLRRLGALLAATPH